MGSATAQTKGRAVRSVCLIVLNSFVNDSRVLKEATSLLHAGYAVQVLAMQEGGLPEVDVVSGVNVRRVRLRTRSWSKRRPVQLIKYAEFMLRAVVCCRNFDILHCNDLNALPVGMLSKFLAYGRPRVIYDAHEFEIDRNGMRRGLTTRALSCLEGFLLRYVSAVITVSPSIAKAYRRIYGIKMPTVVLNCPPYREQKLPCNKFREEFGIRKDQRIFLYQGGLWRGRGIELFLNVFMSRRDDAAVAVFMGSGSLERSVKDAASRSETIFFRNAVTTTELLDYTASADVGLVFIEKVCLSYSWCLPNKLFEYMMAGLDVLCSDLVEPCKIIRQFDLGVCAEGGKSSDLQAGIEQLMTTSLDRQTPMRETARKKYCWEAQEKILLDVYLKTE